MIAKEDILHLKTKILPAGAEMILDFLSSYLQQVELTSIVLENVPLLIIGRHGMIARIPNGGGIQKASQPKDIMALLQSYMPKNEKLYLFVNLPDLPLPAEVADVIREVEARAARKYELKQIIDEALDQRDKQRFFEAVREWQELMESEDPPTMRRF
ncbi:IDEAL domain-containing protein [Alicyclobacillus kakegawensis]|uniref:IDEAL domain-containing protein n=1 Tax=Alicyclobacillus kakegawensis TaxID=392012 RepID=UPI00082F0B50|nr:IDEAL domain-containing protein [Alicyclobacillus kakegawensis]